MSPLKIAQASRLTSYPKWRTEGSGSILKSVVVWTALAPNAFVFAVGLTAMQLASTLVCYDAAFAQLVQKGGPTPGRLIVYLTLIAGFASTIFWPLTAGLKATFGWREILLIFAAL